MRCLKTGDRVVCVFIDGGVVEERLRDESELGVDEAERRKFEENNCCYSLTTSQWNCLELGKQN